MTEPTSTTILLIEDDLHMRRFIGATLRAHGYTYIEASTGEAGISAIARDRPDLVLLDLGLPDTEGGLVVSQVRGWSHVPIIVISSRSNEDDKVDALDRGADDYLTKPFGVGELHARIRAALRNRMPGTAAPDQVYSAGGLEVDMAAREVRLHGQPVRLTAKEYELMRFFAVHAGKMLPHGRILREVWGEKSVTDVQYLRVFVGRLRRKLEDDPLRPTRLITEPGVGYRLRSPPALEGRAHAERRP